jgi:Kef-type K+ transport system membrane component KefB
MALRLRPILVYGLVLLCSVGGYLLIRAAGADLTAPPIAPGATAFGSAGGAPVDNLLHVLIALFAVTALARILGRLCARIGQPRVIGEMIAGIALGPSLLGRVAPELAGFILPPPIAPFLQVISQLGVILYMFLVGVELDPELLRRRGRATVGISHASIVVPFLLGAALALWIYPRFSTSDVPFTAFSLFMGISMSVTAFPVLARILGDRGMHTTTLGVVALTCAAVDDITAWCLLAVVVGVTKSRATGGLVTLGLASLYLLGAFVVLRPLLARIVRRVETRGNVTQGDVGQVILVVIVSALATDAIGIHGVFGAFAVGALVPPRSILGRGLVEQLSNLVVVLFLPVFFAYIGLRTEIGLVSGAASWTACGLVIAVACLGKFGGSALAARASGFGWRDASAIGVLMNTRGLMELIVLNIGLELRVLSPALFAMLVLMALVTTFATTPVLAWIQARSARVPETAQPAT